MKRRILAVLAVLATLTLVGGVAAASIPDASGVIHGCRKTNGGDVKVIDTAVTSTCPGGFVPLNWNQTGPQGPAGAAGANGVSGYEVLNASGTVSDGDTGRDSALFKLCPAGKRAVGGGGGALTAANSASRPDVVLQSSNPYDFDGNGTYRAWRVQMRRTGDTTEGYAINMWVVCVAAS